ncbi:pyruvate kinase alpha/beta domain-containing protein [Sporomusa aerivorans]|uniref:pyruvate kinase alpha/beta domain-containing protein n=1 Tax=Sporomusa aerivorans TaxID=204936 RepID=UPI00352A6BC3
MYWKSAGAIHTEKTVELALRKAKEYGIKSIVVASNSGKTAQLLAGKAENVVCVTHAAGYKEPGANELSVEQRELLVGKNVKVLTTTHVLSGAERGISRKFGGAYPVEIMANTLKFFGQGVKVTVEIAVMALDAGLIPYGEDIIAIGGSGQGADTAVVIRPAHAANIFDTYIAEIICKP